MKYVNAFFYSLIIVVGIVVSQVFIANPNIQKTTFERVIALSPAHTQSLDYLGLGEKIIAVSSYDEDPKYQNRAKVNSIYFDSEDILNLNPDLVLIGDSKDKEDTIAFLEERGTKVVSLKTESFQDIYEGLLTLQDLFPEISLSKIEYFKETWDKIKANPIPKSRTFLAVLEIDPLYTISTNNFLNELLSYSGWRNVIEVENNYPILSEEALRLLPEVDDIIITSTYLANETKALKLIQDKVKAERIVIISNKHANLPSPYLVDIIKELRQQQSSLVFD